MQPQKNIFAGKNAVWDFLNPQNSLTPLVELPEALNPFYADGARIFIKMQMFLPLMNVKSIPAWRMLSRQNGRKDCLVESSSGNMAFSLSILSRHLGFKKMRSIVSSETTRGKLEMLLLSGSEIYVNREPICPDPHDKASGISLAKKMARGGKWRNLNQYANSENPQGHYDVCGMQLLDQTGGDIQIFCSSLGTTGSMIGISRALKDRIPGIACVGVARKPNNPVPGPRTLGLLRMIDFDWKSAVLAVEQAGTAESFQKSMELYRAGLAAGPSSGMALAGLLKYLRRAKAKNALDGLRNKKGEINCVFLGCDTPFLYLDEYFKYLPRSHFPKIKNEGLLPFEISFAPEKKEKNITIKPARMLKEVFKMTPARLWRAASAGALPKTDDFVIADMRDEKSFDCGKIPNSVRVPEEDLAGNLQKYSREWENKKVIFVCNLGEISFYMAKLYDGCGISARSLSEGFMRYSELDYPRVSDSCAIVPSGQRQRR